MRRLGFPNSPSNVLIILISLGIMLFTPGGAHTSIVDDEDVVVQDPALPPMTACQTCAALGKECGVWEDGCDGSIECGSCSGQRRCNLKTGQCVKLQKKAPKKPAETKKPKPATKSPPQPAKINKITPRVAKRQDSLLKAPSQTTRRASPSQTRLLIGGSRIQRRTAKTGLLAAGPGRVRSGQVAPASSLATNPGPSARPGRGRVRQVASLVVRTPGANRGGGRRQGTSPSGGRLSSNKRTCRKNSLSAGGAGLSAAENRCTSAARLTGRIVIRGNRYRAIWHCASQKLEIYGLPPSLGCSAIASAQINSLRGGR